MNIKFFYFFAGITALLLCSTNQAFARPGGGLILEPYDERVVNIAPNRPNPAAGITRTIGDLNNDGVPELALVVRSIFVNNQTDTIEIISGLDFSSLFKIEVPEFKNIYETGDANSDGIIDFAIASNSWKELRFFSGRAPFNQIHRIKYPSNLNFLALLNLNPQIKNLGNITGDARLEIAIGFNMAGTSGEGTVQIYSDLDSSPIRSYSGVRAAARLGDSLENLGDVNGDGVNDLAIGSSGVTAGIIDVVSGSSGTTLYSFPTLNNGSLVLGKILALGDINGDRLSDFAYALTADQSNLTLPGEVNFVSGATGSHITKVSGGAHINPDGSIDYDRNFGINIQAFGDLNRDGVNELLIRSSYNRPYGAGLSKVISLRDFSLLRTMADFGVLGDTLADINQDGIFEIVGLSQTSNNYTYKLNHWGYPRSTQKSDYLIPSSNGNYEQEVYVDYGPAYAGKVAMLVGAMNVVGSSIAIPKYLGVYMPIIPDSYSNYTLSNPASYSAVLDVNGRATIRFALPPQAPLYRSIYHTLLILDPVNGTLVDGRYEPLEMYLYN